MENWTIQHAANAWKSGSHQIHVSNKNDKHLIVNINDILGLTLNDMHPIGYGYYARIDNKGIWNEMPLADLPIIETSDIEYNDFKWGEEVEVAKKDGKWHPELWYFICESKDGTFWATNKSSNSVCEFVYCRRQIKEQPIYTWATFEIKLEELNKMYNHFRNTL